MLKSNANRQYKMLESLLKSITYFAFLCQKSKYFSYCLHFGWQFLEADKETRAQINQKCKHKLQEESSFSKHILFSDNCNFSSRCAANKQNCRIGGSKRTETVYECLQNSSSSFSRTKQLLERRTKKF